MERNFFRGSALATWLGFTATFVARPLGGMFLGILSDAWCGGNLEQVLKGEPVFFNFFFSFFFAFFWEDEGGHFLLMEKK